MLVAVRHGETSLNAGNQERMRGWLPVPLDIKGMRQAEQAAKHLQEFKNVTSIYASDLVRTIQTAHEIARLRHMVMEPVEELRDWNTGKYAGEPVKDVLHIIRSYMDVPTRKIPEGESFQEFLDRAIPFLKAKVEGKETVIAVTHNRVITLLVGLLSSKGRKPDMGILKKEGPIQAGEIMVIHSDWTHFIPKLAKA